VLIKPEQDLKYSDVTPKRIYQARRKFLFGMLAATGAAAGWKALETLAPRSVQASSPTPLQQFLRIRHRQRRAVQKRRETEDLAMEHRGGGRGGEVQGVRPGCRHENGAAGRAHLPASLRGGVVHRSARGSAFR
jgi:hypothetical protein